MTFYITVSKRMDQGINNSNHWRLRLLSGLSSGLRSQQRAGLCCDVTIMVEDVPFKCHKVVLCAVSPYFAAMFAHDMKESRDATVVLHETKSDTFDRLLDCIYDGEDIVTDDNVQEVLEIASMMQIDIILERIEEYFRDKLSVDNFVDIWYMAKKYSCQRLEEFIWKFMTDNFVALSHSGDLALLPLDTFQALLCDDDLVAPSEDFICDASIQWIEADAEKRLKFAPQLISTIRLPLCSPEYIIQNLSKDANIGSLDATVLAVREALQFRICPARKQDSTSVKTTHRYSSRQDDVMVVIGGTDTSEYSGSGMRCYSFKRQCWYTLPSLPQKVGPYYALCTYGDDIFISGGQYHREAFYRFQASTCMWTMLSAMPSGRCQHGMSSVTDVIYVIGGEANSDSKTIHGYQTQTGTWERCGELLENVAYAKTCVLGQNILIFGGQDTDSVYSDVVQSFNTLNQQMTRLTSMTLPGFGSHVVMCDNVANIIASNGQITQVTKDMNTKRIGQIPDFNPKRFDAVQHCGTLHVTTGAQTHTAVTDKENVARVMKIDLPNLNIVETMSIPSTHPGDAPWLCNGTRLSCVKISVGKHHLQELH